MFPDSEIAQSFTFGRTKAMYVANYGIAPYFKTILEGVVKISDCYVISFDESLNDSTQTCQMDLIVRYWDSQKNEVKVRYWDSELFGHASHQDLFKNFMKATETLDKSKLMQISMDGPNVNLKFYETVLRDRELNELHMLINIGSCNLHVVNGAFKRGGESSNCKLKEVLKASYQILKDTPARREDYLTITGSTKYPLFYCATR